MIRILLFSFVLIHVTLARKPAAPPPKKWLTLTGNAPFVVARGGFSGLFPESSQFANNMALQLTSTLGVEVALLCNLQLTKDGAGICQTDIRLDNSTNIATLFPQDQKVYNVNGNQVHGWFALDYISELVLNNVSLNQNILSRPTLFDGIPVSTVEDVAGIKPPFFWLNVPYDAFYTQHGLSVSAYLQNAMKFMGINYISSPEIGFLKAIGGKVNKARTKLIFVFLDPNVVEPTTNQTYSSLLKNLAAIKAFASGILVPKGYIWPVNPNKYLGPSTTLVTDAHKLGLEVYASVFANDMPASYNYSYDPTAEYQQFIDNSQFSVDGVVTDFPTTAAETIACFAMNNVTKPSHGNSLIITHNGASGIYPGCSDLAYEQAVNDGADIIDCSVQMSKDGVAFCLDSPDLMGDTNAVTTFMSRSSSVPEIQKENGIFSFDLTWSEIQTLKPQIMSPFGQNAGYQRNPAAQNQGKLMTLTDFLEFSKAKAVSGILINIENAAYLASKKGLGLVDAVTVALKNATFDQQSTQQVLIQSDDSSVLSKFQGVPAYKTVLTIKDTIGTAPKQPLDEIKKYATTVVLSRPSLITINNGFAQAQTTVLKQMQGANISVFVSVLRNEYVSLAYDYFSDPIVELATYIAGLGVNGVITEFPGTASKYLRSPCSDLNAEIAILPAEPGGLLSQVPPEAMSPAVAPSPPLDMADVIDPPLPAVAKVDSPATPGTPGRKSSSTTIAANIGLSLVAITVISLLFA
ncbi:hypothetical protein SLE2022_186860 [Rubroshorea leprosula]